jgi:RNA polymerase sigma-70 factor, ECF subfamily
MSTQPLRDIGQRAQSVASPDSVPVSIAERDLVASLRRRDEQAFAALIAAHHGALLRVARLYVNSTAVAEEVVQDTWLGVIKGIDGFEGRSSLKTWIFQILLNRARTRGQREGRSIPFSAYFDAQTAPAEPAVDPSQFNETDPEWPGGWVTQPRNWGATPEQVLLSCELRAYTEAAIAALPPSQREVITLRDVQGWTSDEVCNVLGVSETNQRVLLHRARSKVRQALDSYFDAR